jgi:hypothetical protein
LPDVLTTVEGIELIRLEPDWDALVIGSMRAGQTVRLAEPNPVSGSGATQCKGGWYAVKPRGYVCAGWRSIVGGQDDIRARAAAAVLPDGSNPTLYAVGVSIGAPRYLRIPTPEEQRRTEKNLDRHLAKLPAPDDHPGGAIDPSPAGVAPPAALTRYFSQPGRELTTREEAFTGMKVAWGREFDAAGRTWLVTPDLELIPKDKVRVEPIPVLRGIDLRRNGSMQLPLAFVWLDPVPKVQMEPDGKVVPTGESWPRHSFVPVTGVIKKNKGKFYLQTKDGDYLRKDLVTTIKAATERPRGVGPQDKWVGVRVTHGYLVAYEGDTPVFATAISPGSDRVLSNGRRMTKLGRHTIQGKALSFDMSGVERGQRWRVEEVPWVAVYKEDYALHAAWWHNEFGRPKSHGCINLSPIDARFLFGWLDPALPEGWYTVGAYGRDVKGTVIDVRP